MPSLLPPPHCAIAEPAMQLGWELPPEDESLPAWEEAEGDIKPDQRLLGWGQRRGPQSNANEDPHPALAPPGPRQCQALICSVPSGTGAV